MSIRDCVLSGLCPFGIVSFRDCVHSGLCPFGIVSIRDCVFRDRVQDPTNSDLMLARFVKRRVDSILSVAPSSAWKYVSTAQNPADVGTRETSYNNSYFVDLWLNGPEFLLLNSVNVNSESVPIVSRTSVSLMV